MKEHPYQQALQFLNFEDVPFPDLPEAIGAGVNQLLIRFPDHEEQIIHDLPEIVRLIYLISETESIIANDGLLTVFINYDRNQIDRFETAIEQTGHKTYISLFKKARSLAESKYTLKAGISMADDLPEADIEEFFGLKLIDRIEALEEKLIDLQSSGKYWDHIHAIYTASPKK
nr:hypothetical protein [uncultured Arsenicibacter sp.]